MNIIEQTDGSQVYKHNINPSFSRVSERSVEEDSAGSQERLRGRNKSRRRLSRSTKRTGSMSRMTENSNKIGMKSAASISLHT